MTSPKPAKPIKPANSPTADGVRASVIRRPTGAAATARAASALQNTDQRHYNDPSSTTAGVMRTTVHLPAPVRTGIKRRALDAETTMTELIRTAIDSGLQEPHELAAASLPHRRVASGPRTTLDIPRDMHRTLKRLAADEDTSVQALVLAAILQTNTDLA